MMNRSKSLDIPTASTSQRRRGTKDTGETCRERASADLLASAAMLTANERLALERSAENWTLRAEMLDRIEKSFNKRRALDLASRQYKIDHVRL